MRPTGQYPGSIYDLRVVMRLSTCTNIIRNRNFLPFVSTWVHPQKFGAIQLLIVLVFCVVFFSFCLSLFCVLFLMLVVSLTCPLLIGHSVPLTFRQTHILYLQRISLVSEQPENSILRAILFVQLQGLILMYCDNIGGIRSIVLIVSWSLFPRNICSRRMNKNVYIFINRRKQ